MSPGIFFSSSVSYHDLLSRNQQTYRAAKAFWMTCVVVSSK